LRPSRYDRSQGRGRGFETKAEIIELEAEADVETKQISYSPRPTQRIETKQSSLEAMEEAEV